MLPKSCLLEAVCSSSSVDHLIVKMDGDSSAGFSGSFDLTVKDKADSDNQEDFNFSGLDEVYFTFFELVLLYQICFICCVDHGCTGLEAAYIFKVGPWAPYINDLGSKEYELME